ncbi:MAG TPA: 2,3-bisphosphoglycerate-independent phosphoglycerate mutase, partial [Oligoflexia bacterium]|nr:2,3-bisphosphoglycerate-independent phosphoglycerate mutase [Oligoflexia bacterium]
GRIVYQELTRINRDIRNGAFRTNSVFKNALLQIQKSGGRLHLMGLLSDAGVHSTWEHLKALVELASPLVPVTIHPFTDGRDTPPGSARGFLKDLELLVSAHPGCNVGTIAGRYYAMDRDTRWDRTNLAFDALCGRSPVSPFKSDNGAAAAIQAFEDSYAKGVTDEFLIPQRLQTKDRSSVGNNDGILFFNFRADRARQLTRAFTDSSFSEFDVSNRPKLSTYVCMTEYHKDFGLPVAFPPQNLSRILPEIITENGLSQFRIAETEKYAHVTFFFNGGKEKTYTRESRLLIPSPKDVPTYDLKPEMSLPEVSAKLTAELSRGETDFVLVNFANPDMIGHTGSYEAALRALEAVDLALKSTITAALAQNYEVMITADHGNIEEMHDEHDQPHTQHTLNPVPFHLISNLRQVVLRDGILADLAPTILQLLGLPQPKEMTGKSLIKKII